MAAAAAGAEKTKLLKSGRNRDKYKGGEEEWIVKMEMEMRHEVAATFPLNWFEQSALSLSSSTVTRYGCGYGYGYGIDSSI